MLLMVLILREERRAIIKAWGAEHIERHQLRLSDLDSTARPAVEVDGV
jgi:hypothetical protein